MVPKLIRGKLSSLRWRERGLRLIWRSAIWVLIAVLAVAFAFAVDWVLDLRDEVPRGLRLALVITEILVAGTAVLVLLYWPGSRKLDDDSLALFVEDKEPTLGHRLISTVQLNRPKADTRGMSPGLIKRLSRETEEKVRPLSFAKLADHRRLRWAALVVVPLALIVMGVYWLVPSTIDALLARQMGADVDIPRLVRIHSVAFNRGGDLIDVTDTLVRPQNEEVVLRFAATGVMIPEAAVGEVKILPKEGPWLRVPMTFERTLESGVSMFAAKVPMASTDFDYRAWLDDGRTRQSYGVHMEPRPAIVVLESWVKLPSAYDLTPDSMAMKDGDVVGLIDGTANVVVAVQEGKRLESATLEVLEKPMPRVMPWLRPICGLPGSPLGGLTNLAGQLAATVAVATVNVPEAASRRDLGPEVVAERVAMMVEGEGNVAGGSFTLRPGLTGYRVRMVDQYGFENVDVPRRAVKIVDDQLPLVELLPERLTDGRVAIGAPESEIEGKPILANGSVRIAYRVSDDYGLRLKKDDLEAAQLVFRVIRKGVESDEETVEPWQTFPLRETVRGDEDVGAFDLKQGVFEKTSFDGQVEFFAIPAVPGAWGRLDGGGRLDFQIKGVQNLMPGDKLEFFVEVYDRHPDQFKGRPPGRSEVRVKDVVTATELIAWIRNTLEQERKLRDLEKKQSGVFNKPNTP